VTAGAEAATQADLVAGTRERFEAMFPGGPQDVAIAPGRVNLIGEHTDYNEGFVLPMAIGLLSAVAFRPRPDRLLRVHAAAYGETATIDLDALRPRHPPGWAGYVAGMAWALRGAGHRLRGMDAVIDGNIPLGAGLSSSAALEMAVARALAAVGDVTWDPPLMAILGQRAENQYVGVNCGVMDQMASAACRKGSALLLDCRSLETEAVPVPDEAAVMVMDTGARRELATSAYNDRRAACEAAVRAIAATHPEVQALRDVDEALLASVETSLPPVVLQRARHVVAENHRPRRMAAALKSRDLPAAGRVMNESHESLRLLYEVSSPELDLMAGLARSHPACFGARMTGGGFGGCAVALVGAARVDDFTETVQAAYREKVDLKSAFLACRPAAGARLWSADEA
jgi:galactokinase